VYSPFRDWGFEACVFVVFDSNTYDVMHAIEIPASQLQALAREARGCAAIESPSARSTAYPAAATSQHYCAAPSMPFDAAPCQQPSQDAQGAVPATVVSQARHWSGANTSTGPVGFFESLVWTCPS
jgi:hypothetical protein